jgi:hypothetical protein
MQNVKYNDSESVAVIRWSIADLKMALEQKNIVPTDANIELVLNNRFTKTLEERSIEEGWEIIDTIISITDTEEEE